MKKILLMAMMVVLLLSGCSQPEAPVSESTTNHVAPELDDRSVLFERVAGSSYAENDFFITKYEYETKNGMLTGVQETTYQELDSGSQLFYVKSDANGYVYKFDREVLGNRLELNFDHLGNTLYSGIDVINNILVVSSGKLQTFSVDLKNYNEAPYIRISGGRLAGSIVKGNYYYMLIMEDANTAEAMIPVTVYRYSLNDKTIQSIGKIGDVGTRGYPSQIENIFKDDKDVYVRLFKDIYKVTESVESTGISFQEKTAVVSNIEFYNNNYYAVILEDGVYKMTTWDKEWNRLEMTEMNKREGTDYSDYADRYQIRIDGKQVLLLGEVSTSFETREYRFYTYDINKKEIKHTQTIAQ